MSETIRLRIEPDSDASNADSLQYIQGSVEQLSERESWPDNLTFKVNLVLEEIGLNILSYGGEDPDQKPGIEIVLTSEDDSLTIEVVDDGRPFNPLQDADDPDTGAMLGERPIGGLGVHLVKTLMDDLIYERIPGGNRLIMVARRE